MGKNTGLEPRYFVSRVDGRHVGPVVVLPFSDPNSWDALFTWADTVEAEGYLLLARDVRDQVNNVKNRHDRKEATNGPLERDDGKPETSAETEDQKPDQ